MNEQPPKRVGLMELLRSSVGTQFVIPVYQRSYTWTAKKEVRQYFDDLKEVIAGNYDNHFLGIIIYLDTPLGPFAREFSVIDGQQRLTTTFLMVYAIRDILLEQKNKQYADSLEQQYLTNTAVDQSLKLKLKPLVSDGNVYQQIINRQFDEITEEKSNVYQNYLYLKDCINKLVSNGKTIEEIIMSLDKVYLVCVPLSQNDNAQKIFESINSTGAKLTASDLIRNYILMTIQSEKQDYYYNMYWKPIEVNILNDSKKLEMFFRMFLAVKMKNLSNINFVYKVFVEWYKTEVQQKLVEDILKDIKAYSNYYNILYYGKLDTTKISDKAILDFRKMNSDMPAPLVMDLHRLFSEKLISEQTFSNCINYITVYLLRRALCSCESNPISRIFPSILNYVLSSCDARFSDIEEKLKKYLVNANKAKSSYMPDDKELTEHLHNDNMYIVRVLRFVLDKIELQNNSAPVDLNALSIEHLMPQEGSKWLSKLGINEDEYLKQRNRLGNLTLISKSDNSKAQNNIWDFKKELFASTGHLKMNEYILNRPDWNIEEIEMRTNFLISKIIEMFPYFSASANSADIIPIHIWSPNPEFTATGFFYCDSGAVEIVKDSMIADFHENLNSESNTELYEKLEDEGIIEKRDDGYYFTENRVFYPERDGATALSTTAGLLLNGSRNGKEYWLDEFNNSINKNETFLKSKYRK